MHALLGLGEEIELRKPQRAQNLFQGSGSPTSNYNILIYAQPVKINLTLGAYLCGQLPMDSLTHTALLVQIKGDNPDAFNVLFERHRKKFCQTSHVRLDDDAIAQNVVPEIFIKIWQRRKKPDVHTPVENYLQGVVRFGVISHFRGVVEVSNVSQIATYLVNASQNPKLNSNLI